MDNDAITIVDIIIEDLLGRAGFDEWWESIDWIDRNLMMAALYGKAAGVLDHE